MQGEMRIRVIDIETTGDAPPDAAVCEIGWCDVVSTKVDLASDPCAWDVRNPHARYVSTGGAPIDPRAAAIHHIVEDDLIGAPPLSSFNWLFDPEYREVVEPPVVALCAHSAKFERMFLTPELTGKLPWICTYKAGLRVWPDAPSHSNQALRYWRRPEGLDRSLALLAHRAGPDAYVTAHHLRDLLNSGVRLETLFEWTEQPALQTTCHIGAWRGKKWADVDDGFLNWLLGKDFDEDVHFTARHWLDKRQRQPWGV